MGHTVEKIGGTSMSRVHELRDTVLIADRDAPYGRIFVVSAFGGITNLLLEHKKSGEPGVYAAFASGDGDHGWLAALDRASDAMIEAHRAVLDHPGDHYFFIFITGKIDGSIKRNTQGYFFHFFLQVGYSTFKRVLLKTVYVIVLPLFVKI